tara:strand:- start:281 stop:478 length:198 start_codon:yes stop_codon:yes gene_type:complete
MTYREMNDAFFPQFPPEALVHRPSRLLAWLDRQRQRAALARLDDRMLDDIGVTRDEAVVESRRLD